MTNRVDNLLAQLKRTRHRRFANMKSVKRNKTKREREREKSWRKVSASFTAPCSGARKQKGEHRRRGPSGRFERRFLAECGRNAEAWLHKRVSFNNPVGLKPKARFFRISLAARLHARRHYNPPLPSRPAPTLTALIAFEV